MSASQGIKFKVGGFFKQIFQRPPRSAAPLAVPETTDPESAPVTNGNSPANANGSANGKISVKVTVPSVTLPLQAVLAAFPLELRPKIRQTETDGLTLTVPFEKILPQLSSGMVKVTFGDIRRIAPHVFAQGLESDGAQVCLPLNEVLSRISPAMLVRRSTQKKLVSLPDEIASPFAGHGSGLSFGVGNTKPAPAAPSPGARAPVSPPPQPRPPLAPVTEETTVFHRKPSLPSTTPAKEPIFARKPALPAAPTSPSTPTSSGPATSTVSAGDTQTFQRKPNLSFSPNSTGAEDADLFVRKPTPDTSHISPVASPSPTPPSAVPPRAKDFLASPPVARSVQPARAATVTSPSAEAHFLIAPLAAFAEVWPDAVRQEIVQLNLVDVRFAMPLELIESSLKRGRVAYPWKLLRSWIRPATPPSTSTHDATELELPLNVLAPLFMAQQNAAGKTHRVAVDETIPNLFFGLARPEPASTPKPADTNYYTWAETADQPRMDDTDFKRNGPSGTDFVAKYATPNEIVSRAAALDGVAGVLIALPDGLMVASRIPPEHNGDTLAAFLPQIFSKVSQCTKELRMGDLNNLNFTVGNVPWKIFRVNAIYFAAFGRAGEQMSTSELVALAAELDHRR